MILKKVECGLITGIARSVIINTIVCGLCSVSFSSSVYARSVP